MISASLSAAPQPANPQPANPQPANPQPVRPLFKNRFEIVLKIGKGGFGTIYLARDHAVLGGGYCVIKRIRYKKTVRKTNAGMVLPIANSKLSEEKINTYNQSRFRKEALVMARLGRHPQLPCLLDHFSENNLFYLIQEYIPGETLEQEFDQNGAQTEARVVAFLREVIPVIRYIHRHNLLHLDIKPSNLMRRRHDQKIVLIDFGAVRRYSKDDQTLYNGRCSATIGYAPGEQLAGKPTPASDLYALGVTCLYLLTGRSPIDLATSPRCQDLYWQDAVRVSPAFYRILEKLLAPDVERRFQSIHELENALNRMSIDHELVYCLTSEPLGNLHLTSEKTYDLVQEETSRKETFRKETSREETSRKETYLDAHGQSHTSHRAKAIRRLRQRRRQFTTFTPS